MGKATASTTATVTFGFSLRRLASARPAVPPPAITSVGHQRKVIESGTFTLTIIAHRTKCFREMRADMIHGFICKIRMTEKLPT